VITAFVALVAVALIAMASRGFRHRIRWAIGLTTVAILVLFQWPILTLIGRVLSYRLPVPLLKDVAPVAIAVALLWIAKRRAGGKPFGVVVGVAGIATIVVLVLLMSPLLPLRLGPVEAQPAAAAAPDTMLIVLDGYVRDDVLAEQFGFDNSAFLEGLEERGFFVAREATANYNSTHASLSTMLAQDYTYRLGPVDEAGHVRMREALAGDAAIVRHFKEAGYEVAYIQNGWAGSTCSDFVDVCIRDGLVLRAAWYVGQSTMLAPIFAANTAHPFNSASYGHLVSLGDIAERSRSEGTPRFTIAHIILPHPPYHRDAECRYENSAVRRGFETTDAGLVDTRRALYALQATCTNTILLAALDQIIAAHPDTHVMITADHGSATTDAVDKTSESRSDAVVAERMRILSAYRLPGCGDVMYPTITPVNGSRILTNCALATDLAPLEDRNYWIPANSKEGSIVDVAWRLSE
jgi:hypothetical protein